MTVVVSDWPEDQDERDVEGAGGTAMSYASTLHDFEHVKKHVFTAGSKGQRPALDRAREVLARAEEVDRTHPDAVFTHQGGELLLSEAVKYLRGAINRLEIYDV
jgi:hypothetical protein